MRDDDAALVRGAFENLNIRSTNQAFFRGRAQIAAARSEAFNDVRSDVLVCQEGESRAASRRDSQLPGVLAFEHVGGVTKRRREAVSRELRILGENLLLGCAARRELEQELDAEPRATDARLAAENLRIGDDQILSHWSHFSPMQPPGLRIVRMAGKTRVVTWNGTDLPAEFRDLPAGRYVVEAVEDDAPALSPEEESGIEGALESYRQGGVVEAKRAREIIDAALER
jgi:hypothetical protein